MRKVSVALIAFILICSAEAFAAHPLITDDTGTQGKGKMQLEFIGEYGKDTEDGVTEKGYTALAIPALSYGISDNIDILFSLPYVSVRKEGAGETTAVRGLSDTSIEFKARFHEKNRFSLAVKPGISLPTGNEEKGLGNGKPSYSVFFMASSEADPWVFHFNVGYTRNEYKLAADEDANRKDLWHVSLASEVEIRNDLNLVANIGMERNPYRSSKTDPAFVLVGFIYSIAENLDVDMGLKAGLNSEETDCSVLTGIAWRF